MLKIDLAAALDEVAFARSLGLEPDPWQGEALRDCHPRALYNCARQTGKSTVVAVKALHRAHFYPGSLVLLMSPSQRQSVELLRKVLGFHRQLDTAPAEAESTMRLELKNGSRIVTLPATTSTIRGYSGADLLVFDEAAQIANDLYNTVVPMMAVSRGRLIALSTPYGRRGWWADAWFSKEDWRRFRVTAEECPRIDRKWLEEAKRTMGEWWYRQEFEVEFLDAATAAFSSEQIDSIRECEAWDL